VFFERYIFLNDAWNLLFLLVVQVEVTKLVRGLVGSNNTDVITEKLLLQELLGEVLEITLRHVDLGGHVHLVTITVNRDGVTEHTWLTLDLNSVTEELLESIDIENLVLHWSVTVNSELGALALLDGLQ
jgi:hypothetical protein